VYPRDVLAAIIVYDIPVSRYWFKFILPTPYFHCRKEVAQLFFKYTTYAGHNLRLQVIESHGHGKIPLLAHQSTNGVNPSSGPTLNPREYQNFAAFNLQIGLVDSASKDGPTVYGVSSVSRIDKVEGLLCKRAL